jgi:hypothetical protein
LLCFFKFSTCAATARAAELIEAEEVEEDTRKKKGAGRRNIAHIQGTLLTQGGAVQVELCWTHSLQATGFEPFIPLNVNPGFKNVPFKFNLRRCTKA